jgi:hypothetical protein
MGHWLLGSSVIFSEVFLLCPKVPVLDNRQAGVHVDGYLWLILQEGEDVHDLLHVSLPGGSLVLGQDRRFMEDVDPPKLGRPS